MRLSRFLNCTNGTKSRKALHLAYAAHQLMQGHQRRSKDPPIKNLFNGFYPLTIAVKPSILDGLEGPDYALGVVPTRPTPRPGTLSERDHPLST